MENAQPIEDVVAALGFLCLGSRFRRLGEQLQAETGDILSSLSSDVPVAHFPYLAAIDRLGPLGVGEMAMALGVSQPGVTRSLNQLVELGVVEMQQGVDRRARIASLTERGRDLVARSKAGVWARVERAVAELCQGLDGPLLDQLSTLENRLEDKPLRQRGGDHAASAR